MEGSLFVTIANCELLCKSKSYTLLAIGPFASTSIKAILCIFRSILSISCKSASYPLFVEFPSCSSLSPFIFQGAIFPFWGFFSPEFSKIDKSERTSSQTLVLKMDDKKRRTLFEEVLSDFFIKVTECHSKDFQRHSSSTWPRSRRTKKVHWFHYIFVKNFKCSYNCIKCPPPCDPSSVGLLWNLLIYGAQRSPIFLWIIHQLWWIVKLSDGIERYPKFSRSDMIWFSFFFSGTTAPSTFFSFFSSFSSNVSSLLS